MKAPTGFDLIAVDITPEEKRALTALLYSGLTGGALERLGLEDLTNRLAGCFNGPWQYDSSKDNVPTLDTYGVPVSGNIIEVSP